MEGPRGEQTRFSGTCGPRLSGMSNHSSTDLVRGFGQGGGGVGLHLGAKLTSEGQLAVSCSRSRTLASPRGLGFLTALWRL